MDDALTNNAATPTATPVISLWQTNSVAIKISALFGAVAGTPDALAALTGIEWPRVGSAEVRQMNSFDGEAFGKEVVATSRTDPFAPGCSCFWNVRPARQRPSRRSALPHPQGARNDDRDAVDLVLAEDGRNVAFYTLKDDDETILWSISLPMTIEDDAFEDLLPKRRELGWQMLMQQELTTETLVTIKRSLIDLCSIKPLSGSRFTGAHRPRIEIIELHQAGGSMFERSTVFIVGAGASREINLPMGAELTGIIGKKVNIAFSNGWEPASGDNRVIGAIRHILNQKGERDGNPYYSAGRAIASGMAQAISIDNYLHAHAENDLITWVGKLGIAASILEAEKGSKLAPDRDRETVNLSAVSDSWYTPFFQMLTEGIQRTALEGIFDNVAFITFNYDRCIEHYLMNGLANYFRIDHSEAQALVLRLRIEHPYGQVGRLPWQNPRSATAFGMDFNGHELPDVAAQIRTFTERIEDGNMLARTRSLIGEAEVVVYLGFSYGDMNMELLSVEQAEERSVFGTSYGISGPNKKVIERDIINSMGPEQDVVKSVELADMKCVDFLRAYWRPIMRGI